MCDAECVPEYDVSVDEVFGWVRFDPCGNALGGVARCLRDVAACRVQLIVIIYSDGQYSHPIVSMALK